MGFKITVLPGDGVGPEVCREAVRILRALSYFYNSEFRFEEQPIGGGAILSHGTPLPESTLEACLASDAVFLGAVGAPEFDHLQPDRRPEAGLLRLRTALGGFANLRPAVSFPAIADCSPLQRSRVQGADILFVRELLGGLYFAEPRGFDHNGDSAFNTMRYSTEEIERVAHVAFQQARTRRKKVTSVDKANVLETSQLWRRTVTRVAKDYPDIKLDHMYVDACAMHLITNPTRFDVVLTENLFGDILSDEAAAITGSLGMLAWCARSPISRACGTYTCARASSIRVTGSVCVSIFVQTCVTRASSLLPAAHARWKCSRSSGPTSKHPPG